MKKFKVTWSQSVGGLDFEKREEIVNTQHALSVLLKKLDSLRGDARNVTVRMINGE